MIRAGRVAGIDFWDIYNWTWGEVQEFVSIVAERNRAEDLRQARLDFQTATLIARMFSSSNEKFDIMNEYDWLFTDEQRKEAKIARLLAVLEKK